MAAKNSTNPLYETVNRDQDVISLLSILLSVCVKNLSGTKMDPLFDAVQIISTTLTYTRKQSISNSNFGDAVLDQVLDTTSQCSIFIFGEIYHTKVLCGDGCLTFATYSVIVWHTNLLHLTSLSRTAYPAVHVRISRINTT